MSTRKQDSHVTFVAFAAPRPLVIIQYPTHVKAKCTVKTTPCGELSPNSGSIHLVPGYRMPLQPVTQYKDPTKAAMKVESLTSMEVFSTGRHTRYAVSKPSVKPMLMVCPLWNLAWGGQLGLKLLSVSSVSTRMYN